MPESGGSRANKTGRRLESFVRNLLIDCGYEECGQQVFDQMKTMGNPIFATQYTVGESIYKTPRICDFILYHPELFPGCQIIECKWQGGAGSVDEKFPYLVLNIQHSEYDCFLVLDGGGYKDGAEKWIRSQSGVGRLIGVYNMAEFQLFANKGKLG